MWWGIIDKFILLDVNISISYDNLFYDPLCPSVIQIKQMLELYWKAYIYLTAWKLEVLSCEKSHDQWALIDCWKL